MPRPAGRGRTGQSGRLEASAAWSRSAPTLPRNFCHTGCIAWRQSARCCGLRVWISLAPLARMRWRASSVEALGLEVHLHGDLVHDPLQFFADVRRKAIPELRVGDHHVVHQAVVGLGEILLYLVDLLALVVRPGVLGAIHHAGLQALVDLGEGHLPGDRAELAELLVEHVGRLHAEFQPARVFRLQQRAIGGELLHPVVPVGQAEDALALHAGQQGAPLRAALEAVDRLDVVEEERQVEDLHLTRVLLELGQGRRQHLHVAQQQRLHFLAVAEQRRVGIDVYLDPAAQALFDEFLEQQRALAFGRVFRDHVGELDDDRLRGIRQAGATDCQGAQQRPYHRLEHFVTSDCCCAFEVSTSLTQPARSGEFAIAQPAFASVDAFQPPSPGPLQQRRARPSTGASTISPSTTRRRHRSAGLCHPTRPLQFRGTRHQCLVDRLDLARMDAQHRRSPCREQSALPRPVRHGSGSPDRRRPAAAPGLPGAIAGAVRNGRDRESVRLRCCRLLRSRSRASRGCRRTAARPRGGGDLA